MSDEILNEISRFDNDYHPDAGIRPGIATLVDGNYEFEITSVELSRTAQSMDAILKLGLQATSGPLVELAYFFKDQRGVNKCGADLSALGFAEFLKSAGFSTKLKGVLPRLKSVRFRARKLTEEGKDNKVYHNLYISGRVAGTNVNGPTAATTARAAPPSQAVPAAATQTVPPSSPGEDDIPF